MTTQSFLARLQSGTVRYSKSIFITLVSLFSLFTATAVNASTIVVPAGGDLQAAIDAAHFGDTIILQANATYNPRGDSFVLPNKGLGTGTDADYITIQTSGLANIAAAGQRIAPQTHASSMARLVGATGYPVLVTSVGAHHYKFIGIEITTTGNPAIYTPDLVNFGSYFSRQERISTHHFVFDRTFIHTAEISGSNLFPSTLERTSGRGIAAGVTEMWIINSYIAGFAGKYPSATPNAGQNIDSYGVYADAGPGPLHINNNYIEAQFNNVFIGGAGMTTTNVATVTNPTLTSATLSNVNNLAVGDLVAFPYSSCTSATGIPYAKPWQTGKVTSIVGNNIVFTVVLGQYSCPPGIPDNNGTARWNGDHIQDVEIRNNFLNKPDVWNAFSSPKAWVEIKEVRNGVIDGNDMYSGIGTAIAATVRNQDGGSPWSTIENLSITNNRVRGYKWGFSLMLTDNEQPSVMGSNITIQNNLFDLPKPVADSPTNFVQLVGGHDITIRHNTLVQPGNPLVGSLPTPNLVFKDNIVANYQYGMQCTVVPYTLSSCWSNLVMTGNVVIDTRWNKGDGPLSGLYPAGNFYPNDAPSVGFVDAANGNFALSSSSAYKGRASDGTDPGVNMTTLLAALGGSVSPTPTPTPTPSPTVTPTPTPTPTATPTPTPTPTPSPTPSITVNVTSPSNNSTFALGSNVTLTATASKQGGVISNVKFVANTQAVGTSTVSPYSTVWTNPAAGNYTVTAVATDNTGASVTSTSIIVKISKSLKAVRNGKGSASAVETTLTSGGAS
ncbi:MAG TPA: Ig-like domain-containing protein, partial [Pyrinomonadaceae bacterium]